MLRQTGFFFLLTATFALAACDGSSTGGTGATGGGGGATGGSGGATGGSSAGGSSAGGSGGATGGSSAGGSATGGSSTGGTGGSSAAPQCKDASSCQLVNDCCSCLALGPGETAPDCNITECLIPTCTSLGKATDDVLCVVGQCVAALNCDHSKVACDSLPPQCPPGQTPTVSGLCWGGCAPAVECATVAGCDQCTGGLACVEEETQIGPQYHCVAPPPECSGGTATCACMGGAVCVPPFDVCTEAQGSLKCSCPNC